jgi:hypothetical protein
MNVPQEPIHTWEMSRDSILVRWYVWCFANQSYYEDNPYKNAKYSIEATLGRMNFCKMFWLVVCSILLSPLILAVSIVVGIVMAARSVWPESTKEPKPKKAPKVDREEAVESVASFFDKISAFFQRHPNIGKYVGKVAIVLMWAFIAVFAVAVVWAAVWAATTFNQGFVNGIIVVAIIVGVLAAAALIAVAVAYLIRNTWFGNLLDWIGDGVWGFACFIGRGFRNVWRFLALGHHAVKNRTCPRITIK